MVEFAEHETRSTMAAWWLGKVIFLVFQEKQWDEEQMLLKLNTD